MEIEVKKLITSEVDIFNSIMQESVIENKFKRKYDLLAITQWGEPIKFKVKSASNLYLDLKNSRMHVLAKITKADKTNIDAKMAALVNLTLHLIFYKITLKLNNQNMGDTSQIYPYWSHWMTLLNFSKHT